MLSDFWLEGLIAAVISLAILAFVTRKVCLFEVGLRLARDPWTGSAQSAEGVGIGGGLQTVNIPGPTELPLLFNTLELWQQMPRLLDAIIEYTGRFGPTFTFRAIGMPRYVVITRPETVRHVLKDKFDNYVKGPVFHEILKDLLGDGIFNTDGKAWYVQRKTASHMFSHKVFTEIMEPVFLRHGDAVVSHLGRAAAAGSQLDMQDLFFRFTLDSIGEIAFGVNIGSLEDPDHPFARAFDRAQYIAEKRFFTPFWRITETFGSDGWAFRDSVRIMDEFAFDLIRRRRDTGDYVGRHDVLSRFMRLTDEHGKPLVLHDDKYLRDVIMNFIIAGRDTTAQALSWTVYHVAQHPEVEEAILEEIRSVMDPAAVGPSYEESKRMHYLNAVIRETLRLFPSVPKDVKQAVADDTLPDGSPISAGDFVVYVPYAMGRDTTIWGEDAASFRPERMLADRKPDPFAYPVFNAGLRTCLGQDMALFEATCLLAIIYKNFHLTMVPGQHVRPLSSLTLPQEEGVRMTITPRTRPSRSSSVAGPAATAAAASPHMATTTLLSAASAVPAGSVVPSPVA